MNVSSALNTATNALSGAGVAESRREASSLLAFILAKDRTFLIAHPEYELTANEAARFTDVLRRRRSREPLQYITGMQEFYGLKFDVTPDVLIPRPETELLVEAAIDLLLSLDSPRFCELGLGSGCISVSILYNVPGASALGVDISAAALALTTKNAAKHEVDDRLIIRESNLFDGFDGKFDVIVSNPPYVPEIDRELLQPEVRDFEPHTALFGGDDGLTVIRRIVNAAPKFLRAGGFILIEIGFGQAESVEKLFDPSLWRDVAFLPDLQGIARIVKAKLMS